MVKNYLENIKLINRKFSSKYIHEYRRRESSSIQGFHILGDKKIDFLKKKHHVQREKSVHANIFPKQKKNQHEKGFIVKLFGIGICISVVFFYIFCCFILFIYFTTFCLPSVLCVLRDVRCVTKD